MLQGVIEQPGLDGAIFAPSFRLLRRVVLPTVQQVLPRELWTWHPAEQCLRFVNGSTVWCLGTDRQPEQRIVGMNLAWACYDEAGASPSGRIVRLINQRLRIGDPARRFLSIFTSPHGHGWLSEWAAEEVAVIRAATYDNTFLDAEYLAELERDYPPGTPEHEQELLGLFISRTGLVYGQVFSRALHTHPFTGDAGPYVLTCDPGYRASAWLAWQRPTAIPRPWVVVRQWLPHDQVTEDTAAQIKREIGRVPARVLMDTPSRQNSRIHQNDADALRDVFGPTCAVRVLGGYERSADWRHKAVLAGLRSGALRVSQRLCPARLTPGERGLVHALETAEWPRPSTRDERQDQQDPRKHVLDALEFGAAILTPPRLARSEDRHRRLVG